MEGGIEASNRRNAGKGRVGCLEGRERLGLVEWSKIGKLAQALLDLGTEHDRPGELDPAVNNPVPDRVNRSQLTDRVPQSRLPISSTRRRKVCSRKDRIVRVNDPEL